MPTFNKLGQWTLTGNEEHLLFKTAEKKMSGKGPLVEKEIIQPDSEKAKEFFNNLAKSILSETPKQPTNEQMFGSLVPTEEQIQAAEKAYQNRISDFYTQKSLKDADKLNKNAKADFVWENGRSFNDCLKDKIPEEEMKKRHSNLEEK